MIDVYIQVDKEHVTRFAITGHANYAAFGKDIVCAAISALTNTLEETLNVLNISVEEIKYIDSSPQYMFTKPNEITDLLMKSYCIGVNMISEEYPEYVTLHLNE